MNRLEQCIKALEKGNVKKAYDIIEQVAEDGNDDEMYLMCIQLKELGFHEEIIPLYKKLIGRFPEEGELLLDLAEIYINLGREEEALLVLNQIHNEDPAYLPALLLLADMYQSEGLFEVSEAKLLEAEKLAPNEPVIQFALAELYNSIGRFAEAVYKYETLAKDHSEFAGVNINERLASIFSMTGEFEKALSYYEKNLEQKLDIDSLFGCGMTLYQLGNTEAAIQKFNEVKELDPDYVSIYYPLAKSYEEENELEKALDSAKTGYQTDPFHKELAFLAGKLSFTLGKLPDAEEFFQKALELDPEYIDALRGKSMLLIASERYQELIAFLSPIIKNGEEDPELMWNYSEACRQEEKYSEALNGYRKAYKYLKESEDFLQNYGEFLIEAGNREDAIEVFTQLSKTDPTNVDYIDILERLESDLY